MTEVVIPTGRKLILTYSRKVSPVQYETVDASATMEVDLPPGTTVEQARKVFDAEYPIIKSEVLRQLGLPFTYEDEGEAGKIVREVFPDSTVVGMTTQRPATQATPFTGAPTAPTSPLQAVPPLPTDIANPFAAPAATAASPVAAPKVGGGKTKPDDIPYWNLLAQEITAGNLVSFWDNRPKKASGQFKDNASDFAHKDKDLNKSLWLNTCPPELVHLFQ